jgi:biotin synthase-like enzyme
VHRYNHNLETARSYFGQIVSTHGWQERHATCELVKSAGMELCCGDINAIIVGNYLTTLGRPARADLEMPGRLRMPIKALSGTL